jgi:hypothetical protein
VKGGDKMEEATKESIPDWHVRIIRAALKWALEDPLAAGSENGDIKERSSDK